MTCDNVAWGYFTVSSQEVSTMALAISLWEVERLKTPKNAITAFSCLSNIKD
jgi:hypothetical protein